MELSESDEDSIDNIKFIKFKKKNFSRLLTEYEVLNPRELGISRSFILKFNSNVTYRQIIIIQGPPGSGKHSLITSHCHEYKWKLVRMISKQDFELKTIKKIENSENSETIVEFDYIEFAKEINYFVLNQLSKINFNIYPKNKLCLLIDNLSYTFLDNKYNPPEKEIVNGFKTIIEQFSLYKKELKIIFILENPKKINVNIIKLFGFDNQCFYIMPEKTQKMQPFFPKERKTCYLFLKPPSFTSFSKIINSVALKNSLEMSEEYVKSLYEISEKDIRNALNTLEVCKACKACKSTSLLMKNDPNIPRPLSPIRLKLNSKEIFYKDVIANLSYSLRQFYKCKVQICQEKSLENSEDNSINHYLKISGKDAENFSEALIENTSRYSNDIIKYSKLCSAYSDSKFYIDKFPNAYSFQDEKNVFKDYISTVFLRKFVYLYKNLTKPKADPGYKKWNSYTFSNKAKENKLEFNRILTSNTSVHQYYTNYQMANFVFIHKILKEAPTPNKYNSDDDLEINQYYQDESDGESEDELRENENCS